MRSRHFPPHKLVAQKGFSAVSCAVSATIIVKIKTRTKWAGCGGGDHDEKS